MKFIGYIPFGYPSIEKSIECIETYVKAGCEAVEISFPAYDPIDESELIIEYMHKALSVCDEYEKYIAGLQLVRRRYPKLEINWLLFTEIINKIGIDDICSFYKRCKIACAICPDIDEYPKLKALLINQGMKFSAPIHYDLNESEIENCLNGKGFVYMQAFPLKGQKVYEGFETPLQIISYLRERGIKQPIYAGVGIKTAEDVRLIKAAGADGFFVGGTLMKAMNDDELPQLIQDFINAGL